MLLRKRFKPSRSVPGLIAPTLLALSILASGQGLEDDYWLRPIPLQGAAPDAYPSAAKGLSPGDCGVCHIEQYRQWSTSYHRMATSAGLLGQLRAFDQAEQTDCLNCHAPRAEQQQLWYSGSPDAYDNLYGVGCATCHVRAHRRFGPRTVAPTPHGDVRGLDLFSRSTFCLPCHQFDEQGVSVNGKPLENTYQEWQASRYPQQGMSCQGCHMRQGRHEFLGIHDRDTTRNGLKVSARRGDTGVLVVARNAGAGHALPTYSTPRIRIIFGEHGGDANPQSDYIIQWRLTWDPNRGWKEIFDTRLLPDQRVELTHSLAPERRLGITVLVEPDADYHERVYPELLEAIGDDLPAFDRELLEQARVASGRSAYVLYCLECKPWEGADTACDEVAVSSCSGG